MSEPTGGAARARTAAPRVQIPLGNSWPFAVMAASAIMAIGLVLDQALAGRGMPAPSWPDNGLILLGFLVVQVAGWGLLRGTRLYEGLAGTRLAVVTVLLVGIWAVFLGTVPQVARGEAAPIYQRVMQAPPFVLLILLMVANLGWGMLRHLAGGMRGSSLRLFSHAGIYLSVLAGLFGSGDVRRLDVWVGEGDLVWTGTDGQHELELPFAIHLHEFTIANFPPQLTVLDARTGESLLRGREEPMTLSPGKQGKHGPVHIRVREVTDAAPWSAPGDSVPAAYVEAESEDGVTAEGWVSSGSRLMPPIFLGLGTVSLVMPDPRPREFASHITLVQPDREPRDLVIRVNEPLRLGSWWIYQRGYRLEGGRFSQFQAVHDPWLPAVFAGLGLLATGALLTLGRAGAQLRKGEDFTAEGRP